MPTIYPSRNRRVAGPKSEKPNAGKPARWYSREYLVGVWAQRPAKLIALLGFVVIVGLLIIVFAASPESTVWSTPTDFNNAVSKTNVSVNSNGTVTLKTAGVLPNTDDGTVHRSLGYNVDAGLKIDTAAHAQAIGAENDIVEANPGQYASMANQVRLGDGTHGAALVGLYEKSVQYLKAAPTLTQSWYAHTATGGHVDAAFKTYDIMQPDSAADPNNWNTYQANNVNGDINTENAKSVYKGSSPINMAWLDSMGHDSLSNQVYPGTTKLYSSNPTDWYTLVNHVADKVKATTNKFVFGNGIDTNQDLVNHTDGTMEENWLWNNPQNTGNAVNYPSESSWQTQITDTLKYQVTGKALQVLQRTWGVSSSTAIEQARRFSVASYFIANKGGLFLDFNTSATVQPWNVNDGPSMKANLGQPITAPGGVKDAASGVHIRYYQNGAVLVNNGASTTVNLDKTGYKELDGTAAAQGYHINANSGVVLTHA